MAKTEKLNGDIYCLELTQHEINLLFHAIASIEHQYGDNDEEILMEPYIKLYPNLHQKLKEMSEDDPVISYELPFILAYQTGLPMLNNGTDKDIFTGWAALNISEMSIEEAAIEIAKRYSGDSFKAKYLDFVEWKSKDLLSKYTNE